MFFFYLFIAAEEPKNINHNYGSFVLLADVNSVQGTTEITETTRRRRRSSYIPPKTMSYKSDFNVIYDTLLADGVRYKIINWGGTYKHRFHAVEVDLSNSKIYLKTLKAHKLNTQVDKLQKMVSEFNTTYNDTILAAINANFWKAGSNYPIGPTVMDGEIIEMHSYKEWSSGLFDAKSRLYIDNFKIEGTYIDKKKKKYKISNVNRRSDSTGIVIYNQFGGNVIPFISPRSIADDIKSAIDESVAESEFADSTDFEIDSLSILEEIIATKQMSNSEFNYYKATCNYINAPALNKKTYGIVQGVSKGVATMPINGFVVSFGADGNHYPLPKPGDTISIEFKTNKNQDVHFFNAVSGTPRLVRDSLPGHEAQREGSKAKRFLNMQLPRTAIGTNKGKSKLFFVTVEASATSEKKVGASLSNIAKIMSALGAYDAMNLDGGGSSMMIIDEKNVLLPNKPESGRKVSVGIAIILDR